MIGTTTAMCDFSAPTTFDGTPATTKQDEWHYASSTCVSTFSPTAATGTPTMLYTFTAGDVAIFFALFVIVLGMLLRFLLRTNA